MFRYRSISMLVCLLWSCFFSNSIVIGQLNYTLPTVINPSPQSTAFTRYGDYPMASYTGLTDITVPLHTVIGKKLSLPITMSFHASGRMANEINGTLGMRWTFNCGGLVTRTMKGYPDEWNWLTPFDISALDPESPGQTIPSFDVLYSATYDGKIYSSPINNTTIYDTEYDIFNYSLPNGKSGNFILKNDNGNKVAMLIPYESLKVEIFKDTISHGFIEYIKITDTDGTQYFFGKINNSTANAVESAIDLNHPGGQFTYIPTGWYLTKILSSDETDQITLSYTNRNVLSYNSSQSANIGDRIRNSSTNFMPGSTNDDAYEEYLIDHYYQWHVEEDIDPIFTNGSYYTPTVNGVQFNGGSVSINYTIVPELGINNSFLNELIINKETAPFRRVKFQLQKPTGSAELYFLNELKFYGEDQTTLKENYSFDYYHLDQEIYPVQTSVFYKDWWGYYKPTSNLLPRQTVNVTKTSGYGGTTQDIGSYVLDRDPSESGKKTGMLKTITYPTGGQTEFVYEANLYEGGNEGPGLRIKEIVSKPVNGKNVHKLYTYGVNEDGKGFINNYLKPGSISRTNLSETEGNSMHFWNYFPAPPFSVNGHAGFRERNYFSDPYINFDLAGSPIKYEAVNEYYIEGGYQKQKTQVLYKWGWYDGGSGDPTMEELKSFTIIDQEPIYNYRKFSNPEFAWLTPIPYSKTFYKYANEQFVPIKKELYEYVKTYKDEAYDMPTYLHTSVVYVIRDNNGVIHPSDYYNAMKNFHNNNGNVYGYGFRKYLTGVQELYKTIIEEYTPAGVITTEKEITYDDVYNLVKSEEVKDSRGQINKTTYKYPHDYQLVSVYQQMVNKNILSPVIEKKTSIDNVDLLKIITNYHSPHTNIYVPQSIEIKNKAHAQEVVATFNNYDNFGNIREQQKKDDVKDVYLWGYNGRYPIAKIIGSDYSTVNAIVTQTVLDNGTDAQINTQLALLRTAFASDPLVQVFTYTYKPLVGMTSETAPNGKTTYYEYDNFNRLRLIKDNDGKILRRICYNYAGQVEDCGNEPLFFNTSKSGTFTRNNCGTGFTGGSVAYVVPANKYTAGTQAAADALAQEDINTNGQEYANTNATCTATPPAGVYARLELDDFYEDIETYSGPWGYELLTQYANLYLRFYSDAACTVPLTLSSSLTYSFKHSYTTHARNGTVYNNGDYDMGEVTVQSGVSSYLIGDLGWIFYRHLDYDEYDNNIVIGELLESNTFSITAAPGSSTMFTPVPIIMLYTKHPEYFY